MPIFINQRSFMGCVQYIVLRVVFFSLLDVSCWCCVPFRFQYRAYYLCGGVFSTSMIILDAYVVIGRAFVCPYTCESIVEDCCGAPPPCRHVRNVFLHVNVFLGSSVFYKGLLHSCAGI